ncbi:MAG: hypothetical protein AB8I08_33050 [Sandaracinaceae bacterium]
MMQDAVLARFEKSLSSHSWSTARFFRRGAESLLSYCAERGHDILAGDVSRSLLCEFVEATEPERRLLRGAVAFCRFLRSTGVRLPLMDDPGLELLSQEQLAVFMDASSKLGQPYGCFFQLLPLTKLPSTDLMNVLLDGVKRDEDGQAVLLRSGQGDAASDLLLNDKARRVLTAYLDGWRSKDNSDSDAEADALLFVTKAHKPLSASTVSRKLRALQDAAGLPDFRITALRTIREPQPVGPGLKKTGDGPHLHVVEEAEEEAVLEVAEAALAGPPEEEPGPTELGEVSGSKTPATSSTPGREIRRMLPLRGVVHIKKRIDAGKTAYVGKYNIADVGEDEAIEPFIGRFLVPELGPGEYLVYDHARAMSPIHSFNFLDLPSKSAERSHGSVRQDGVQSGEIHAVHPAPGSRGNTAYEDAYLTVRREEAARRRDEELQHTLKELRDENKRLRQEIALMRRERDLSPIGVGPLPPLATPEDPLKAVYLDAVRRNQQIVDELIKKNLGVSGEVSDADQWDKFVALANGPLGRLLESKFGSDNKGGRAFSGPPPWARRGRAPSQRPEPEPPKSGEPKPNRGAANAGVGDARGSKDDRAPEEDAVPDDEVSEEREVGRELPASAIPFLEKMERAESEEELVESLLRVLAVLHLREDWRADIRGVFQSVIMNRTDEALDASWALLRELVAHGHLTDGAARAVVMAIHESWDGLRGRAIELAQQVAKRAQASAEEGST